jgi:hypothetical protein
MPIGYLDVPTGAERTSKERLVKALYDAMHEAYPFPDDTRIFLREWPPGSVSLNGSLGSDPIRPVFVVHVPKDADVAAKRRMLANLDRAVAVAYGLPEFAVFLLEHALDTVVINGRMLADDQQRVEEQARVYDNAEVEQPT